LLRQQERIAMTIRFSAPFTLLAVMISTLPVRAVTLDDVMARLEVIQRDNAEMRKELTALRKAQHARAEPAAVTAGSTPAVTPTAMSYGSPADDTREYSGSYDWSGMYAGVNGGYAGGSERSTLRVTGVDFLDGSASYSGMFGGFQIGANVQYDSLVFGAEADLQAAAIGGRSHPYTDPSFAIPFLINNKLDSFATLRGRAGYAFDRVLPFVTGGVAVGHNTIEQTGQTGAPVTDSILHLGWVVGGGVEYAVNDDWTAKAEYLHMDFGAKAYLQDALVAGSDTVVRTNFDLLRFGVNRRF
jgi:outer membrane immunogenic protein